MLHLLLVGEYDDAKLQFRNNGNLCHHALQTTRMTKLFISFHILNKKTKAIGFEMSIVITRFVRIYNCLRGPYFFEFLDHIDLSWQDHIFPDSTTTEPI